MGNEIIVKIVLRKPSLQSTKFNYLKCNDYFQCTNTQNRKNIVKA